MLIDGLDENGGFILGNLKDGEFVKIPQNLERSIC